MISIKLESHYNHMCWKSCSVKFRQLSKRFFHLHFVFPEQPDRGAPKSRSWFEHDVSGLVSRIGSQHNMLDQWLDQHLLLDYHFCSSIFIIQTVNNWRSIPILRQDGTTRLRRSLCGHSSLVTKRYQVGHFSFGEHNSPLGRIFAALWPPWRLKGSSGTKTEKFFVPWHYESDGYGSIPINTIFRGMNIHLPAILMFTRGTRFWHTAIWGLRLTACCKLQPGWIIGLPMFCPVP